MNDFQSDVHPVEPNKVNEIKTADGWDIALETLSAIATGIGDILVPSAY